MTTFLKAALLVAASLMACNFYEDPALRTRSCGSRVWEAAACAGNDRGKCVEGWLNLPPESTQENKKTAAQAAVVLNCLENGTCPGIRSAAACANQSCLDCLSAEINKAAGSVCAKEIEICGLKLKQ